MDLRLFLFFILLMSNLWADDSSVRKSVLEILPPELSALSRKTPVDDVRKKFSSRIKREDKDALLLKYFSDNNDVTVGLRNGQTDSLYVELPVKERGRGRELFNRAMSAPDKVLSPSGKGHEGERFISVHLPGERLKLKFHNNENHDLHSIIMFPESGSSP